MSTNQFEDNSSLYDVEQNRFTRPSEPTLSKATKQAALKLAVLYELAYKGLSGYSDKAVSDAYTTLADELMVSNGYVNSNGQLAFEVQPDGSAIIKKASK